MKVILALRGSLSFTQSFLLLTDLPSMLTLLEEDYQLEYSESYTGDVHGVSLPLRDINTV